MRARNHWAWLTFSAFVLAACPAWAEDAADPLRLVPAHAEVIFKVEQPRKIVEGFYYLDVVKELQKIESIREIYDSTKARRLYQLLAYFEKQLGHSRFELLDLLAGGGIVVAGKLTGSPAALVVIRAKDEDLLKKFVTIGLEAIEQELARQDAREKPQKNNYRDIETVQIGAFQIARVGSALLFASDAKVMQAALDCHLDGGKKSIAGSASLASARKQLPAHPQAWVWLNLEAVRTISNVKETFKVLSLTIPFNFILSPIIDVAKRSPYLSAGFFQDGTNLALALRMGKGRLGMGHVPAALLPGDGKGALPLLEPANVQASFSYYFDLSKLWDIKDKLLNEAERKELAKAEKASALFLGGVKLSALLKQAGTHHRLVMVQPDKSGYQTPAGTAVGSYGLVMDMRDKAFGKSMDTILRGAGLLASTQFNLKMVEEKRGPYTIVSYHFPEDKKIKGDPGNFRYNFSPCFVTVGEQFIASSTVELGRELVDLVEKERSPETSPATSRFQVYSSGFATALRATKDQLRTQVILTQALDPKAAGDQVQKLIALVQRLGVLQFETHYGADDFRYDIQIKLGK